MFRVSTIHRQPLAQCILPEAVSSRAHRLRAAAGAVVFAPHYVPHILVGLSSGTLRIDRPGAGGGPALWTTRLTEAEAGYNVTAASLLAYAGYPTRGVAETDIEALALPRQTFEEMIDFSSDLRGFVLIACARRMTSLCGAREDADRAPDPTTILRRPDA